MTDSPDPKIPICFTKQDLLSMLNQTRRALDGQIYRAVKSNIFLKLKNGLFISTASYIQEPDKAKLSEYIASRIYEPSYISLEYVLKKHNLLPLTSDTASRITSVTSKTNRTFTNFAGNFTYRKVKASIYFGFEEAIFHEHTYQIATKAKALFDYLYLDSNLNRRNEKQLSRQLFQESAIQWNNFSEEDFVKFDRYVWDSNSFKMMTIRRIMERYFENKKIDQWAKNLLA